MTLSLSECGYVSEVPPHTEGYPVHGFCYLLAFLKVLLARPLFVSPLHSRPVSNNLVIFHHISSTKQSISDAIHSRLQHSQKKSVSKKVNVILKA